jgi:hypothetical protein
MNKSIKIITRLCKEAGIYPGKYYKGIISYIDENNSYVFYGRDKVSYSRFGTEFEIKFLRLQFDILEALINNNLLGKEDYKLALKDTLTRYDVSASHNYIDGWTKVARGANKKEFVEFFFDAFEKKIGKIKESTKRGILLGLPKY